MGRLFRVFRANTVTFALVCSSLLACARPGTNWLDLQMATSANAFDAPGYPIEILVRFENKADRNVSLDGCKKVPCAHLEQWKGYAWFEVAMVNCLCIPPTSRSEVIPPGGLFEFMVTIASEGRFRVRVQPRIVDGEQVRVYSNEFLVGSEQASRK